MSLICTGVLFRKTESAAGRCASAVQSMVGPDQKLSLHYDAELGEALLAQAADTAASRQPTSLIIIYSYGDFRAASQAVRSNDPAAKPIEITRDDTVPQNKVVAFFSNPFGNLDAAQTAPLKIENALITPVPQPATDGWWRSHCSSSWRSSRSGRACACGWRCRN